MSELGVILRKQQNKLIESLKKKSHFGTEQIESLLNLYRKCSDGTDKMDRNQFREFLHHVFQMTDDIILDRIYKYFDMDNDGIIGREEWVLGLSVFLKGTPQEHIRYCFHIYDLNGDDCITKEEMLTMLKTSLGRQIIDEDPDEGVKDLIEMTLRKLDVDKDGRVSFSDWQESVEADSLMLEAFGPCLPSRRSGEDFLHKLENNAFL
ncbi:EF-hand calcium-binding domain-containing protein 1 [Lepeophtheirus salmonis]|uniref:EF-hand calcium-binding domain-containing protein 1 n=3 Tax=Lepeophtheirus salmonis TaxID=72036 RepID=A0A7R8D2N8_LEPSM|nr:EF-hand calcium-binding domain-containing protein 1 [Lepeophtheirus salmonis]CAF3006868.1 EF-hand calcium-binding domain-containing protein 1 [Lepeophtheirus salmonis]